MLFDKYRRICTNDHLSKTTIILFRQTVRTFTLEHLISYTVGLAFLFVFSFYLLPGSGGCFGGYSGVFRDAPLFPTMATPLEKALFSKGSRCRKVGLWHKAVSGFGKT